VGSIEGSTRLQKSRFEPEDDNASEAESEGMKTPLSRKDLMFVMRRSEDAEGESRMMGNGRVEDEREVGIGALRGARGVGPFLLVPRSRDRKGSASLRTCEKSWSSIEGQKRLRIERGGDEL
jgi:hypothetical protein